MNKESIQLPTYSLKGVLKRWEKRHKSTCDYGEDLQNTEITCHAAISNYIKELESVNPDIIFIKH